MTHKIVVRPLQPGPAPVELALIALLLLLATLGALVLLSASVAKAGRFVG